MIAAFVLLPCAQKSSCKALCPASRTQSFIISAHTTRASVNRLTCPKNYAPNAACRARPFCCSSDCRPEAVRSKRPSFACAPAGSIGRRTMKALTAYFPARLDGRFLAVCHCITTRLWGAQGRRLACLARSRTSLFAGPLLVPPSSCLAGNPTSPPVRRGIRCWWGAHGSVPWQCQKTWLP